MNKRKHSPSFDDRYKRRLMRMTKATLVEAVMRLSREVGSRRSGHIPVTVDTDMRRGDTMIVRVPAVFVPNDGPYYVP